MAKSKILLIGKAGFIGRYLFRSLQGKASVEGVESDSRWLLPDIKYDAIINCNGNGKRYLAETDPELDFRRSVSTVMESVSRIRSRKYIYLSSIDVYNSVSSTESTTENSPVDAPSTVYGFHKQLAEKIVLRYSSQPHVLRLGTVIGPQLRKNPVFDIQQGNPLRVSAESYLNLVHLEFLSEVLSKVLSGEIQEPILNVAASQSIPIPKVIEKMGKERVVFSEKVNLFQYRISTKVLEKYVRVPSSEEALGQYLDESNQKISLVDTEKIPISI